MKIAILTVLIAAVSTFGAVPKGVDLASLSNWDIVISADAIGSEKYAAKEFQNYLADVGAMQLDENKAANC